MNAWYASKYTADDHEDKLQNYTHNAAAICIARSKHNAETGKS